MAVQFHGGPANGQTLMLRRAPALLRVTRNEATGEFDALDQIGDEPEFGETVSVYKIRGTSGRVHLCYRGKNRGMSGWYATAEYDCLADAPALYYCAGEPWERFAEELAAVHFPDLLPGDVRAAAVERIKATGAAPIT